MKDSVIAYRSLKKSSAHVRSIGDSLEKGAWRMTLAWIAENDAFEASEFDALRSLLFKVTRGAAGPGAPLRRENENMGQLAQEEMRWMAVAPRPS